ncbi:hypothetical protein E4U39_002841 [Claviceps sp. Clav50 group G5]|nr:hypothetical protein E4U39_002841 [Claviceps sp. Clav50 group G5]
MLLCYFEGYQFCDTAKEFWTIAALWSRVIGRRINRGRRETAVTRPSSQRHYDGSSLIMPSGFCHRGRCLMQFGIQGPGTLSNPSQPLKSTSSETFVEAITITCAGWCPELPPQGA